MFVKYRYKSTLKTYKNDNNASSKDYKRHIESIKSNRTGPLFIWYIHKCFQSQQRYLSFYISHTKCNSCIYLANLLKIYVFFKNSNITLHILFFYDKMGLVINMIINESPL